MLNCEYSKMDYVLHLFNLQRRLEMVCLGYALAAPILGLLLFNIFGIEDHFGSAMVLVLAFAVPHVTLLLGRGAIQAVFSTFLAIVALNTMALIVGTGTAALIMYALRLNPL